MQMRSVEKVALPLSRPVGGSVPYGLDLDAAVFILDDGVSSGIVGRYVSVGDVSGGGDMELCDVDTVLSGAVSGGLCELDSVTGGGDTDVSGIVMSGADTERVSRADIVVIVDDMSFCQEVAMQLCLVLTSLCVVSTR